MPLPSTNRFSVFDLSELGLLAANCLRPGRRLPFRDELEAAYHEKRDAWNAAHPQPETKEGTTTK